MDDELKNEIKKISRFVPINDFFQKVFCTPLPTPSEWHNIWRELYKEQNYYAFEMYSFWTYVCELQKQPRGKNCRENLGPTTSLFVNTPWNCQCFLFTTFLIVLLYLGMYIFWNIYKKLVGSQCVLNLFGFFVHLM